MVFQPLCEFLAQYALTALSGYTVALFAYGLRNKDNGNKNRRLSPHH